MCYSACLRCPVAAGSCLYQDERVFREEMFEGSRLLDGEADPSYTLNFIVHRFVKYTDMFASWPARKVPGRYPASAVTQKSVMRQDYLDRAGKRERVHLLRTRRSDAAVRPVLTTSLPVEIMALSHIISWLRSPATGYKKLLAPFGVLCSGPELW